MTSTAIMPITMTITRPGVTSHPLVMSSLPFTILQTMDKKEGVTTNPPVTSSIPPSTSKISKTNSDCFRHLIIQSNNNNMSNDNHVWTVYIHVQIIQTAVPICFDVKKLLSIIYY